ncbi:uncharacterized protein PSFLO_01538 [Pseudozyma flocculosa]|nr:uncharacterized protein PSFLO_01538 [Pseudozyma flocculosa]
MQLKLALVLLPALAGVASAASIGDKSSSQAERDPTDPRSPPPETASTKGPCNLPDTWGYFNVRINTANCGPKSAFNLKIQDPVVPNGNSKECIDVTGTDGYFIVAMPADSSATLVLSDNKSKAPARKVRIDSFTAATGNVKPGQPRHTGSYPTYVKATQEGCPSPTHKVDPASCSFPLFKMTLGNKNAPVPSVVWGGSKYGEGWSCASPQGPPVKEGLSNGGGKVDIYKGKPDPGHPAYIELDYCAPAVADINSWCKA